MRCNFNCSSSRLPGFLFALSTVVWLGGCGGHGPEETVTLEISGVADKAERNRISEKLKGMTDGSSHSITTSSSGDSMTVKLAPVSDVKGFAEKIDFGKVTEINERTIRVGKQPSGSANIDNQTSRNTARRNRLPHRSAPGGRNADAPKQRTPVAKNPPRSEFNAKEVAANLKKMGARVRTDSGRLVNVNFFRAEQKADDETLAMLTGAQNLEDLNLYGCNVTDAGLRHLEGLPRLKHLNLNKTPVGDAGLKSLAMLTSLKTLGLGWTKVTDEGMARLKTLNLEQLVLDGTKISDQGLSHLQGMGNMQILKLRDTHVGDKGLAALGNMRKLRQLTLNGTKVTDAGLENLKGLSTLETLNVAETQVTDEEAEMLEQALPKLNVFSGR